MGKKYIVELGRCERLYKASVNGNGKPNMTWLSPEIDLTPYTEPDIEAVRKEAYEKGLSDAWDAVKKLARMDTDTSESITGYFGLHNIMHNLTASEVIEEIRAYEQAQKELEQEQEEIKVGDEVAFHHDDGRPDTVVVVTYIGQDGFIDGMDGRGTQYAHKNPKKWTKTSRHFTEIDSVLEKMRGEQDG